ncbi:Uncharacterised protein [uncultured archaeon]|nr:Uncharacterised protein [uncultured archaeon]
MKAWYYLAALAMLCCTAIPAYSQEQVTMTVYVHDGSLNGALLSGVQITGQDAAGNVFKATTDSSGVALVSGEPGAWQFAFQKAGYDVLFLKYNATESEEAAAYLEESSTAGDALTAQEDTSRQEVTDSEAVISKKTDFAEEDAYAQSNYASRNQVELTVYVHDGSLSGALLSGVQIIGQDASGSNFEATTDSIGSAAVSGAPGTWIFSFVKDGYTTLNLLYNVTESEEAAAYLEATA